MSDSVQAPPVPEPQPPRPLSLHQAIPSINNLVGFNVFNAMSFNIMLAEPMILLVRNWGASQTFIGLLSSLVPLLMITQLYMAPRVEYIGYRRLILAGWTGRTIVLTFVCILPFVSHRVDHALLLWILFGLMVVYNLLRGVATTSYMPWLRTLIDGQWRGRYISIEHSVSNFSAAATFFFCAFVLEGTATDHQFGYLFLLSTLAGWASIVFLRRIDSPPPLKGRPTIEPVSHWAGRVWRIAPFRRLIITSICFYLSISAWRTFTVVYLRDAGISESTIMLMSGCNMVGIVLSAWVWGQLADRFGSRPIMALATRILLVMLVAWLLLTMHILPPHPVLLTACFCLYGLGFIGFHVANMRQSLNSAPREFPVLALSLFMIGTNLSIGFTPIAWGAALDLFRDLHLTWEGMVVDRFTLFYGISILLLLLTKWRIRRLPDERAAAPHLVLYHMLVDTPLRTMTGVYELLKPSDRARDRRPPKPPPHR